MASYQQRIPLKGTEESIDFFTNVLKATKNFVSCNSAEALLRALVFWQKNNTFENNLLNKHACSAAQRNCGRVSRIFYLQVLTTPDIMEQINSQLDRIRRGYALKSLLDSHAVGRAEFLLEALIFIIECFKEYSTRTSSTSHIISSPSPSIDYSGNLKYPLKSLDNQVNPCVKPPMIPSNRNMLPPLAKPRSYEERRATTNYETMNNENVTNSRNYRENSSDISPTRRNYRENSFDIAPARLGSVGPGGRSEEDNPRRQRSWRSQIRDQQLADNRRLLESVKRKCSPTPERERCYTTDKQFGPSPQIKQTYTTDNQTNRNYHYNTREDNKNNEWMPVHELAINKHTKVEECDQNNNSVINGNGIYERTGYYSFSQHSTGRRDISEPTQSQFKSVQASSRKMLITSPAPQPQSETKTLTLSKVREKWEKMEKASAPVLSLKDRKTLAETLCSYLNVQNPDLRETPGYDVELSHFDRIREGVDCDQVFSNIVLGNGATVKKKDYLRRIGITHILNSAEYRGVNVGNDYFNQMGDKFKYLGIRIEDTPQTQICKHFVDAVEFMDDAVTNNGKVFVNCVYGKSRSTSFVVVYLMLCHDWTALDALRHIRKKRPVQLNPGFLLQIVDLDYKLKWQRVSIT